MKDMRERIKKLMEIHKIPYTHMEDKIGAKSFYRFHGYMHGNIKNLNMDTLIDIADFFNVSVDYLLGRCDLDENYEKDIKTLYMKSYEQYIRHCPRLSEKRYPGGESLAIAPWPYNLLEAMKMDVTDVILAEEAIEAINYLMKNTLTYRESLCVYQYFKEEKTYDEIGQIHGLTRERIRQIIAKAVRKLRHPSRAMLIKYGIDYRDEIERRFKERREKYIEEKVENSMQEVIPNSIADLNLSVRATNSIARAGIESVAELILVVDNDIDRLKNTHWVGKNTINEIRDAIRPFTRSAI